MSKQWARPPRTQPKGTNFLELRTTFWQYTPVVPGTTRVSPDGYESDNYCLARNGADDNTARPFPSGSPPTRNRSPA